MQDRNQTSLRTTKNVQFASVSKMTPLARRFESAAKKAGLWFRMSHGSIWIRPEDCDLADAVYAVALGK